MSDFNNAFGSLVDSHFSNFEPIKSFLPNQLPIDIKPDWRIINKVLETEKSLESLRQIIKEEQTNFELTSIIKSLKEVLIYRESSKSSAIEGTRSTALEMIEHEKNKTVTNDDLEETLGSKDALKFALDQIKDGHPLNLILIREAHDILLSRANLERKKSPGKFRSTQVAIGSDFYPAPPLQINELMRNIENYINDCKRGENPDDLPPILRMALLHYQFETVHPFEDGNGRIGRMLISLLFRYWEILPESLVHLGDYFKMNKERYYVLLFNVSKEGDIIPWFDFFLDGVINQSRITLSTWSKGKELRDQILNEIKNEQNTRLSTEFRTLLDFIWQTPFFTIKEIEQKTGLKERTIRNNIDRLIHYGLLEPNESKRNKIYYFKPYWKIIG